MTPEEKVSKAKALMILSEPFFSSIAMNMDYIPDESIKTACTNGHYIKYSPSFVEKLSMDHLKFTLAHEVLHITQLHHTRQGFRNGKKWNKACDYAVNPLLRDAGFDVLPGSLMDVQYEGMSAEQIYNMLPDEPEDDEQGDNDPGGCGGVEPPPAQGQAEMQQEENDVREMVAQALNNAQKRGTMSSGLKRAVTEALEPKVDWKEVLTRFLSEIVRNDYTFRKANSRYIHTGFFLPALENEEIGEVILVVDTSGSINESILNKFGAEMQEIVNTFGKGFHVVYVDAEVKSSEYIEADGPVKLHPSGGGGTDFIPGFDWVEEQDMHPKALVYFTDGWCDSFPETPEYPVLWAKYGKKEDFNPPFGEIVEVNS